MNNRLFQNILYFIIATIVLTLAVQVFWNYKNYEKNRQNFQNDVQISLDNALDVYYANLAEKNHLTFVDFEAKDGGSESIDQMLDSDMMDSIVKSIDIQLETPYDSVTQIHGKGKNENATTFSKLKAKPTNLKVIRGKKAADSIKLLKNITSIYISIQDDSLKLKNLAPLIKKELKRKQLDVPFSLTFKGKDSIVTKFNADIVKTDYFKTDAKSKFMKDSESLSILYPNATRIILREGWSGILMSMVLVLGVIVCLFYLLRIIKNQRQLSEMKNDLISNMTHEFKTPISTIGVAIESIRDFNGIDDKNRTKNYLNISSEQLGKLNAMVEKLLETATLDSDQLELQKEPQDIVALLSNAVQEMRMRATDETIKFELSEEIIMTSIDRFHIENAINNILDNALKYGGTEIEISIYQKNNQLSIDVIDNGNSLSKNVKDKIFEKFYRVSKGNKHDVKGFGIGLYYTKKIIEKHDGNIRMILDSQQTIFKITLPNG